MRMLIGQSDPATGQAVLFAKGILDAPAAAFYEVDDSFNLKRFLLSGVPADFHRHYVDGMSALDPLHPRHIADKPCACLSDVVVEHPSAETATFQAFAGQCGISDMVDLFFRRNDRIVAGLSVVWTGNHKPPAGAMGIAEKIHDYLEYNLAGQATAPSAAASRYALTSRELDVARLLCCGRTNREIGDALGIGAATVKTHIINIFEKLGVKKRSAAVARLVSAFG